MKQGCSKTIVILGVLLFSSVHVFAQSAIPLAALAEQEPVFQSMGVDFSKGVMAIQQDPVLMISDPYQEAMESRGVDFEVAYQNQERQLSWLSKLGIFGYQASAGELFGQAMQSLAWLLPSLLGTSSSKSVTKENEENPWGTLSDLVPIRVPLTFEQVSSSLAQLLSRRPSITPNVPESLVPLAQVFASPYGRSTLRRLVNDLIGVIADFIPSPAFMHSRARFYLLPDCEFCGGRMGYNLILRLHCRNVNCDGNRNAHIRANMDFLGGLTVSPPSQPQAASPPGGGGAAGAAIPPSTRLRGAIDSIRKFFKKR